MRLSRTWKIVLALVTILPLIYMALFFATIAFSAVAGPDKNPVFDDFGVFMAIHLAVMVVMMALLVFYVVYLFKTEAVKVEMKALWAIALSMGASIAMPIFWYLYIWPAQDAESTTPAT